MVETKAMPGSMPGTDPDLEELEIAAERALGASAVSGLRPLPGGASRRLWSFDARLPGGEEVPLVLLVTKGTAEREWQALRASHGAGIAVAEPLWLTADGGGLVMRRLPGEAIPGRIFRREGFEAARGGLLEQTATALAAIHALPLDAVPSVGGRAGAEAGLRSGEVAVGAGAELDRIEAELDRYGDPHPALELGLRWLRRRARSLFGESRAKGARQAAARGPVLVHGDFRMGNLLVDGEKLRALLDWELVHAGDPAEDLGWLCARTWRFGRDELAAAGLGSRRQLLDAYEAAGGVAIGTEELRFWEALANLRWGVLTLRQLHEHLSGLRPSLELAAIGRRTCEAEWDLLAMVDR
ncbi:MAG: phosphotransferase family protein [Solirubrobacterales bacterium]